jgi:DNA repair protein RecN (Recombination protein N)
VLGTLRIDNLAVIERAEICFGEGLNVLTGETGAGKSIVIDALSAVTGGRASKELVRAGAAGAFVSAEFTPTGIDDWLFENGIELEPGDPLILSRRITADGKNTCRVNGTPVSVAQLRELSGNLIDIHGQNDGRKLLDESAHLMYLDSFAGNGDKLAAYTAAYEAVRDKQREIDAISLSEEEKTRRAESLRYKVDEIGAANLRVGESAEIESRRGIMMNASRLTGAFDTAYNALYGGEDTDGAVAQISEALSALDGASRHSEAFAALAERLKELRYAAEDVAVEIRDIRSGLEFSPQELDRLDERLDQIRRVTRKYGGDEQSALDILDESAIELTEIKFSEERKKKLEEELLTLIARAKELGGELSAGRREKSWQLRERITGELSHLNMAGVIFEAEFEPVSGEHGLSPKGLEDVRFLMSANAGEPPGRISRIASGGELSRIMLALKNVLTENDDNAVMVFDEVDAGVSGVAAQRVGEKLADLASRRQVLVVTHLPQIAAMADTHFEIQKSTDGVRTYTRVTTLDGNGRQAELARMTGGENVTPITLRSAAEQLAAAEKYKRARTSA